MRILSGIQPSGKPHLGNYFAMMKRMIDYQKDCELFAFIVNLHALTTVHDAKRLKADTLNVALDWLALGLDPKHSTLWVQSEVPAVAELAWILSTVTTMGLLERSHSYKDKLAKGILPSVGLFTYPVLMAADILIMQSDKVPVGKDQKQHLEIARDIAEKFNQTFGETFTIPAPDIAEELAVIPGTDGQKMSKSYGNTIEIFGSEAEVKKQIMGIKTDSKALGEALDPTHCTVFKLYSLMASPQEVVQMEKDYLSGKVGYGDAKKRLLEAFLAYFKAFRAQRTKLEKDLPAVEKILADGAKRAGAVAEQTMKEVRKKVGI